MQKFWNSCEFLLFDIVARNIGAFSGNIEMHFTLELEGLKDQGSLSA